MKFDNAQFEQGARTSLSTLEKLKSSMNFSSVGATATKSLSGISGFFSRFGLRNPFSSASQGLSELDRASKSYGTQTTGIITGGITSVSAGFIAMSTVAITALSNIASAALRSGAQTVKSLTLDPVMQGFQEYETNLNSIQTILANTGLEGQAGLDKVNAALQQLNTYSDKTIYNFSEMARNIGTFTAAGVDLDTATASIKGIANLAALSGSNSQQASTAMYQLSQAISAGRVGLMDWNSVVNAGMGGKVFQTALARTAQNMGTLNDQAVKSVGPMEKLTIQGGSFRDSIMAAPGKESWLTGDVLTNTLKQLSGDMTDAELRAEGFTQAQVEAIQKMAQTGSDAATDVKTFTQLMGTLKESVGSGFARSFSIVIGDFGQAKELFSGVSDTLGGLIQDSAKARNKMLSDWEKGGGRDMLIAGISNAWLAFKDVIDTVHDAFRDVFPAKTADDLIDISKNFQMFTARLIPSKETMKDIHDIAEGVFSVFHIVGQIVGAVADQFGRFFGAMGAGNGDFLDFLAGLGRAVTGFDRMLEKQGVVTGFFNAIGDVVLYVMDILGTLVDTLGDLFSGFDGAAAEKAADGVDRFAESLSPLQRVGDFLGGVLSSIGDVLGRIGEAVGSGLVNLGGTIAAHITPETFDAALKALNTALFGALVLTIRSFFKKGVNVDVGGGFLGSLKETLGSVTGALTTMQQSLKADILLKIAAAMGVMAASLFLLSTIDGPDLVKAMTGMAAGLTILGGALVAFTTYINVLGAAKLPLIAAALIGLATAMLIMAGAVKVFQSMELGDMLRGLFGMALALAIIKSAMAGMPPNMPLTAAGILILSVAMNALAIAVKLFATMSWDDIAHGLVAMGGGLAIISAVMNTMPVNLPITAAGMLILAVALNALAGALKIFATFSWNDMAHGGVALAGALIIIAAAMSAMPATLPITAAGLVLVAIALNGIAAALLLFGSMSWEDIGQGLLALGGAMAILAIGLTAMSGALAGAAALLVAAAALNVLIPVMIIMGNLDIETMVKSLGFLAAIFVVLGAAGYLLAPVVPIILGLAVALVLIGAALALAGVGALAFATAFGVIVGAGVAGVSLLRQYLQTLIEAIPEAMKALANGIVAFLQKLANNGPKFVRAMGKIISNILQAIRQNIPEMGRVFTTLILTALNIITTLAPRIFNAGLQLILGFMRSVRSHVSDIVRIAVDIIVKFMNALGNNANRLAHAGVEMIIDFIDAVSQAIDDHADDFGAATGRLGVAIVKGVVAGIGSAAGEIGGALKDAVGDGLSEVGNFVGIGSPLFRDEIGVYIPGGIAEGIKKASGEPVEALTVLEEAMLSMMNSTMNKIGEQFQMDNELNPTITPVLDLTNITREASTMSDLLANTPSVQADVSFRQAAALVAATEAAKETAQESAEPAVTEVHLEQNNYSPKAIDHVTQYRSTKNLLSLTKEALSTP